MYLAISKIKTALVPLFIGACPKEYIAITNNPKERTKTLAKRICLNMLCRFINTKLHNLIQETKYLLTTD
jgi:hypothetical protein